MRSLNLLFASMHSDSGTTVLHSNRSSTLAANATLTSNGVDLTLSVAASPTWVVGARCILTDVATALAAYGVITKVTDSTHVRFKPFQSVADSAGVINHEFPSAGAGSTLKSDPNFRQTLVTLVIDLSDAPVGTYDYLLVGCASASHDAIGNIRLSIRSECLVDDPMSGAQVCTSRFTRAGTAGDPYQYVGSRRVSLTAGQRYEFHLRASTAEAAATVTSKYAHLVALRYSSATVDATHNGDSAAETNATGAFVTVASLATNLAAGDYLLCSTWTLGTSDAAQDVQAQLLDDTGGTTYAQQEIRLANTTDRPSAGFFGVVTLGASNSIKLQHLAEGGATSTMESVQLCAIPISALSAIAATHQSHDDALQSVVDQSSFTTLKTSGAVTLTSGTHLEIIALGVAGSDEYICRPNYAGHPSGTSQGEHGAVLDFSTIKPLPIFTFARNDRTGGSTTNSIQVKIDDGTGTVAGYNFWFSWLREKPALTPLNDTPVTIVAELENGGMWLQKWTAEAALYYHAMDSDVEAISRVIVNGTEYTEVSLKASLADSKWWWDAPNRRTYIDMPSGDTPADSDQIVIVVPLLRVGREHHDLLDASGVSVPYFSRAHRVPGVIEELNSDGARFGATRNHGEIELAAGDRFFDDLIGQRNYQGFRCNVLRGYETLSTSLSDFEPIASAVMELPDLTLADSPSYFQARLFDRGLNLSRPALWQLVTHCAGNTGQGNITTQPDQPVPSVWGSVKKLAAYRVTAIYTADAYETFKFAAHGVSSVTAVYYRNTEGKFVPINMGSYVQATATYIDSGTLRVKNNTGAGLTVATQPFDVVYVDCIGRTSTGLSSGTALQNPGVIARDFLVSYPMRIDEMNGTPLTTIATSNHTSAVDGANCEVASTSGFAVGDHIKVVSHAAATTYYRAYVTAILAGPARLTLVPSYETGDAAVGTVFTFGASSSVRKTLTTNGLAASSLVEPSLRLLDRRWRRQLNDGVGPIPTPVNVAFLVSDPAETVADALGRFMGEVGAVFRLNHNGRVQVVVPDVDAGNVTDNLGAEDTANGTWPFRGIGSATVTAQSTQKYEGSSAFEIANGSSGTARKVADVLLHRSGSWVLTAFAYLVSGSGAAFKLAMVLPSGEVIYGDTEIIVTTAWRRKSLSFTVPQGYAGSATIWIYPTYGVTTPTTIRLDNVELYPVVTAADRINSTPIRVSFRDETYFEAAVTYDVDLQDVAHSPRAIRNDREAKGAALGTPSEGKFAIPSSGRASLETTLATDLASAAGIAAAVASYYSRGGMLMEIDLHGLSKLLSVGEYLFHLLNPRVPTLESRLPIHRIMRVEYDPDDAQTVKLTVERQIDPVADRTTVV